MSVILPINISFLTFVNAAGRKAVPDAVFHAGAEGCMAGVMPEM